ncbi:hypothetical protein N3K66_004078 [Trichothecium roseum]|uniref:Uncharacterized protein n=1 Tax=Trichothecium roseum TaxID=47278 RepID=A0ACC0V776_9HYPO|nr:hypothetical protein N3K66_004078 [Trichothecium roseum]
MSFDEKNDFGAVLENAFINPTGGMLKDVNIIDEAGKETGEKKPRFIIQSNGYLDVKVYVAAGMVFPSSKESFEGLHSKEKLKKLIELDSSIYQETEDAMVSVYQHCHAFNSNALPNFRRITMETKEYSEFAIRQLTGLDGSSFVDMLDILTSDAYGKAGSENSDEFQGATQAASQILLDLSKEANVKSEKIKALVKEISSFSLQVESDQQSISAVTAKFNGTDGKPGYAAKLSAGLTQLRKDIKTAAEAAKKAHDEWESDNATAQWSAAYVWIPIWGWIAGTTVAVVFNKSAMKAWEEYQKQLTTEANKNTEVKALQDVIEDVDLLASQNNTIGQKMTKAIVALKEIQKLFEQMAKDLYLAGSMMGAADGLVRQGLWSRKRTLRPRVDDAVKSWQSAADACDELMATDDNISVYGITPDVTPPKVQ